MECYLGRFTYIFLFLDVPLSHMQSAQFLRLQFSFTGFLCIWCIFWAKNNENTKRERFWDGETLFVCYFCYIPGTHNAHAQCLPIKKMYSSTIRKKYNTKIVYRTLMENQKMLTIATIKRRAFTKYPHMHTAHGTLLVQVNI